MNLREKYLKAVRREIENYVPFYFGLTPPQVEKYHSIYGQIPYSEQFNFPIRSVAPGYIGQKPEERYKEYLKPWLENTNLQVGVFGNTAIKAEDSHFAHYEAIMGQFDSIEDFEKYPYPDPETDFDWSKLEKEIVQYHQQGLAVEGGLAVTIFEMGWYLRGMEQMLMDMVLNEQLLSFHLDRLTEIRQIQAEKMVTAGVDVLQLGDDVATQRGMMIQPDMWRKFLKGRLGSIIKVAKQTNPELLIKYHTDGNPEAIIPDLIEIGIDILNPIQPECIDPAFVKREYGDSLALDGTLGTQSVFPFGSPEDVKEQCLQRIRECGYNGGLILAPSHVIEPEVPWENIEAFVKTVEDYNNGEIG